MMGRSGHISVPEVCFSEYNNSRNSNQDIMDILYSAPDNQHWISTSIPELSHSGSQYIVPRFDGNWFKVDGFTWQRRKNGPLVREDHSKLKVQKVERLNCQYVTSALVKGFQRRVYQLLDNNEFVLIHYLFLPEARHNNVPQIVAEVVEQIQKNNRQNIEFKKLLAQLQAIFSGTYETQTIQTIAEEVSQRLAALAGTTEHEQRPTTSYAAAQGKGLERRNSCSSAFRKGLSSMALRRQPSTFSDSVGSHFFGGMMNEKPTGVYHVADDVRSYSGETQRSSNPDEDSSIMNPASLRSQSAGAASQTSAPVHQPADAPEILDIAPSTSTTKGGTKVLIVGDWYMKGHEYSIRMGDKKTPARLIRPGVLSFVAPPAPCAGPIMLQVLCNDQVASQPRRFVYEDVDRDELLQFLADRLHLIGAAFGLPESLKNLNSSMLDQEAISVVLRSLEGLPLMHPSILGAPAILPSRTIIHLAAQLDYSTVIQQAIILRRLLPYVRELDPMARDAEGCTPLHYAARAGNFNAARILIELCPNAVDVLDDRNRTPTDLAAGEVITLINRTGDSQQRMSPAIGQEERKRHVTSTALWVMTNGETVTDSHLLRDRRLIDEESTSTMSAFQDGEEFLQGSRSIPSDAPHLEISMDTDVDLPDSPKMADLFQAATSPAGMLNDNNRQKMANLARQIIDALPARIKHDNISLLDDFVDPSHQSLHQMNGSYQPVAYHLSPMIGTGDTGYWQTANGTAGQHQQYSPMEHDISPGSSNRISSMSSYDIIDSGTSYQSSKANTFDHDEFDKNLGEFFNLSLDGDIDPVQQRLGNLKLNDLSQFHLNASLPSGEDSSSFRPVCLSCPSPASSSSPLPNMVFWGVRARNSALDAYDGQIERATIDNEQRELYEAAMVIQRAYREYRERNSYRRQAEVECRAAVTIQSCYRRYKQYCYIKQLHSAAIVVQKHFRLKKGNQKEGASSNEVQEHPTLEGQILRIQVPQTSSSLAREHRAATTIQTAYRGHRKRQAAARKIQKFMKENRQKLRRMAEQNVVDSCTATIQQTAGNLYPGHESLQHINDDQ